jgi:hypothetical protein
MTAGPGIFFYGLFNRDAACEDRGICVFTRLADTLDTGLWECGD